MPDISFAVGDRATWHGLRGLFSHSVTIVRARKSYLVILGQTPEDAPTVYDIYDTVTRLTVLGIPAEQLQASRG